MKNVAKKNKDNLDLEPYAVTNDRGFIAQKDAHDDFGYMKDTDRKGSVRLYFYFDKLVQCEMMIPSLEEQKQISTYLDNLDTLITLHQRKLEWL